MIASHPPLHRRQAHRGLLVIRLALASALFRDVEVQGYRETFARRNANIAEKKYY